MTGSGSVTLGSAPPTPRSAPRPGSSAGGSPAPRVLVDVAGARVGGAMRFLGELDGYLAEAPGPELVGRGRELTATWLVRREALARHDRLVALNNVSFVGARRSLTTRAQRWVLLRNVMHFLGPGEQPGAGPSRATRAQVPVVRLAATRADVVVVPTASMAERVVAAVPSLRDRLVVRPHPVTPPADAPSRQQRRPGQVLCPVVFSPFKDMGRRLRLVDEAAAIAARELGTAPRILVTATERERSDYDLAETTSLTFIGRLAPGELTRHRQRSSAVLYPTSFESFGYPLAEAYVERRPVIALDTEHNRDIAGDALVPYARESVEDIAAALVAATTTVVEGPPSSRFDRDEYFGWLFGRAESAS